MSELPVSPPVLTDGTVTLRACRADDAGAFLEIYQDPLARSWTSLGPHLDESDAREWIDRTRRRWTEQRQFAWAVEADDGGRPRFAGTIDVRNDPVPSIGYMLAPWARGGGRMSRALRLAADWAFDVVGLPVLHWSARAGHVDSWRVAHACGFRFEGTRTLALPADGALVDAWTAVLVPGKPVAERRPETTWWDVPVIDGERVRLRPPSTSDVDRLVETGNDPDVQFWSATLPSPYTAADARGWLTEVALEASLGHAVSWIVADRDDDRLLAIVTLFRLDAPYSPTGAEVGYRAHPDARGRGAVSAAVRLAITHAFTPTDAGGLGRHRVQLGAARDNIASRRVAERTGFRLYAEPSADGRHGFENEIIDDGVWYELLGPGSRS